ncbi:exodeoxyribonuclease VII large subunit [Sphingomonas sp. NSE70-1]|uniref:Exodeoxyribonuclease 7 large subunit n=1 Tax=Sphingomonas caseinilyticus TaxID=2908205 RepID=A0ABT0RVW5_9SPHN|nr:exodeoxyribonuclease VII large subunit [Sphingomonas caseinilyticus]MCL6699051.1 exodeoxyribonuclease VII large subunit [Sphingomonas caseinilyticus]
MFMPLPDDLEANRLLAEQASGDNAPAQSVSELSGALKRTIESAFGFVRVRGEISGWKRHASGHCYFTLKDEAACIDAVIWKGQAASLAFRPEDGAEVIATGKLTTYAGRSKYQIVVNRMELAGEGALMALLDRRRRALAAEGLFDESRKRRLPFLPRIIGVVTSPTGAVIRDILHRLEDRCPTHVIVWPVPVQGEGSAGKVAAAIRGFANIEPRPDLLIVARGGGSIEDLWAFNEEEVVRAAAESPIPLISAVGHETDTTLIDFASDRRAPTPTAAAEIAVPVRAELAAMLGELGHRMSACVTRTSARSAERLELVAERWPEAANLFAPFAQRIDDSAERLPRALVQRTAHARADLAEVAPRLQSRLLSERVHRAQEKLAALWRLADLAHPERPLQRGFVRVTDRAGKTIIHAADARAAAQIDLHFADGRVAAHVGDGAGPIPFRPAKRLERKGRDTYLPGQADLFDSED